MSSRDLISFHIQITVASLHRNNHAKYDIPAGISAAGNTECGAIIALSGRKFGLRKVRALIRVCTSNSGFALGDCAGIWGPESSTCAPAFSEFILRAASGNREAEFALHTHAQSTRKTTTPEFDVKPLLPTKFRAHGSRASESGIRKLAGRLRSRACPGAGVVMRCAIHTPTHFVHTLIARARHARLGPHTIL